MNRQVILASTSPRRKQLLELLRVKFKAVDPGYEEIMDQKMRHEDLVKFLALGKAQAAAKKYPNAVIIAADTVVSFNGKAIGKPKNKAVAEKMLKSLGAKSHYIISAVAVLDSKTKQVFVAADKIKIYFRKLSSADIKNYIATGEPMDRAGAYAFQGLGFNFVEKLEGDITTAVGMPMELVYNFLQKLGVKF
jgi:septum formation protein